MDLASDLLRADGGCGAVAAVSPKPKGRFCDQCGAFVTVLGRTEGVFCGSGSCPFPKLSWGGLAVIKTPSGSAGGGSSAATDRG